MADTDILRELMQRRVTGGPPLSEAPHPDTPAYLRAHHVEAALGPLLPVASIDEEFAEAMGTSRHRTAWLLMELERILSPLETAGCAPVVLKGAGLALAHYPDPLERWFVDLDLLVPGNRVEAACDCLMTLGYQPIEPERFADYYDRYHLHRALVGPSRAVVEVHWDLTIPLSVYDQEPDGVRARAVTVDLGRGTCRVASAADQVVHAVSQQLNDGFGDLRRVLDLGCLLPSLDAAAWNQVASLTAAGRMERALALWLDVAIDLAGVTLPPEAPDGTALGPRARRILRNLDVPRGMLRFRARYQPGYARFLHLVLVPGWTLRLRELMRLLFPGEFHLMDAGHAPGRGGWWRRAAIGMKNAEGLARVLVRALGF